MSFLYYDVSFLDIKMVFQEHMLVHQQQNIMAVWPA